jgi:hypothetical protein
VREESDGRGRRSLKRVTNFQVGHAIFAVR